MLSHGKVESSLVLSVVLAFLAGAVLPAVVLPRPPSNAPNFIPQESGYNQDSKGYSAQDKALYHRQNTNVEKPETQGYRVFEIEVQNGENVETLDLQGIVQAVFDNQQQLQQAQEEQEQQQAPHPSLLNPRRLDVDAQEEDEPEQQHNLTYPHPEVVPHSILGVRDVGPPRLYESSGLDASGRHRYLLNPSQSTKNLADEKLYYLKSSRPKVYVNFRGKTGNFRESGESKATMRFEPGAYLRATPPYQTEKKTKSPKKYDARIHGASTTEDTRTTENSMVTSSELPKQIPAPPSMIPARMPIAHTTPVQRYTPQRKSDILPSYAFADA